MWDNLKSAFIRDDSESHRSYYNCLFSDMMGMVGRYSINNAEDGHNAEMSLAEASLSGLPAVISDNNGKAISRTDDQGPEDGRKKGGDIIHLGEHRGIMSDVKIEEKIGCVAGASHAAVRAAAKLVAVHQPTMKNVVEGGRSLPTTSEVRDGATGGLELNDGNKRETTVRISGGLGGGYVIMKKETSNSDVTSPRNDERLSPIQRSMICGTAVLENQGEGSTIRSTDVGGVPTRKKYHPRTRSDMNAVMLHCHSVHAMANEGFAPKTEETNYSGYVRLGKIRNASGGAGAGVLPIYNVNAIINPTIERLIMPTVRTDENVGIDGPSAEAADRMTDHENSGGPGEEVYSDDVKVGYVTPNVRWERNTPLGKMETTRRRYFLKTHTMSKEC